MMEHSAGAVIYRKHPDGQLEYLIVQSIVNRNWGFPKGHLENNETPQKAAQRKVLEEVGLRPEFDFNFSAETSYSLTKNKSKHVIYFLAKYVDGQEVVTQEEEILANKWVNLDEAAAYLTEHDKLKILTEAQNYIEK